MAEYRLIILGTVFTIVLLYLSNWFSSTETALTHLNSVKIAEMKKKKAKNIEYIIKLKKDIDKTIVTLLILNNTTNILLSSLAAIIANQFFHALGISIFIGVLTFMIILFGEILPKSKALKESGKISSKNAKIMYYVRLLLSPLVIGFIAFTRWLMKAQGKEFKQSDFLISDENIKDLTSLGESEGVIKKIEKDIIHKVFLFGDKKIKDIMVPMEKVFYIDENHNVKEARKILSQKGFTRVPIVNERKKVIGILYSKDLLKPKKKTVMELMKKPIFVSGNHDITTVFANMKKSRIHLAVVRDTKYRHLGLVTLEDILEELVGEIEDEYHHIKYPKETKEDKEGIELNNNN